MAYHPAGGNAALCAVWTSTLSPWYSSWAATRSWWHANCAGRRLRPRCSVVEDLLRNPGRGRLPRPAFHRDRGSADAEQSGCDPEVRSNFWIIWKPPFTREWMCERRFLLSGKGRQIWLDMPFIRELLIEMIKNYIFRANILVKWKENSGRIEGDLYRGVRKMSWERGVRQMDYGILIAALKVKPYLTDLEKDILDTWNEIQEKTIWPCLCTKAGYTKRSKISRTFGCNHSSLFFYPGYSWYSR